jgi:hypothetical protein
MSLISKTFFLGNSFRTKGIERPDIKTLDFAKTGNRKQLNMNCVLIVN